ncbi:MAG TPA: thioredoxin domain-containing protein [Pyrinomonadaceae bacterium]|nr:thioredoxin domain-containing protein [Pyrinomonadaceae bacterium]
MFSRLSPLRPSLLIAAVTLTFFCISHASAQTCFDYVDGCSRPGWNIPLPLPNCVNAAVPLRCVEQGPLAASGTLVNCNWNGDCHEDGDPSDCCTGVTSANVQSILEMHTNWHNCFGNVGDLDGNNPVGRGQRWYAFHRQFELDFTLWREPLGFGIIQSLEWCPNMNMPFGHPSGGWPAAGVGAHPAGCGTGPSRDDDKTCTGCIAFPQCLFRAGAGPAACPGAPSNTCGISGLSFPHTSLEQFRNVEEVSTILDHHFHGAMHQAVADADNPGAYVQDVANPVCSPRDPMFWRLHKALDDVVRAWQNLKAVDVVLVIDRSGSMSEPDSGGSTKFAAALNAVDNFADLLDINRTDGQQNRIGIVSYSNTASVNMPLTVADANLRAPGGPLATAISNLNAAGPGGCTGIGGGIQRALELLCPPTGNCQGFSAAGDNDRKAILVLTDGIENVAPCLKPAGAAGGSCGTQCFGASLDFNRLEFTQLVSVGFGNTGSLNGDLLTLLSERQGGVYMQNPNAPGYDLKDFFTKAFGHLTSDFIAADPKGVLAPGDAASEVVEYNACSDGMITFASGWQRDVTPGGLRLLVTTPADNLVRAGSASVQNSTQRQWAYSRIRFPYRGESTGTWSGQLIRPHLTFVNGFTPDSFARLSDGTRIVRREIQRLCPDGCKDVLYFEHRRAGRASAYEAALKAEQESELLSRVERARNPAEFATMIQRQKWDLIVYARMGDDSPEPYDSQLAQLLCGKQKAIITDTRAKSGAGILRCAGAFQDGTVNWPVLEGDGRLFKGRVKLDNPGHAVSSYGIRSTASVQATAPLQRGMTQAIVARVEPGEERSWFMNVLADGLSRLSPVREKFSWRTGEDLVATVRVLPSDLRSGGYDHVDARVEVEYPTVGLGTLLTRQQYREPRSVRGEQLDPRAAALARLNVPTKTATFRLYDDGTHGDLLPGNAYWSAKLPGLGTVDGMYKFRFILDFTVGRCTTRRELVQSIFVDVGVKSDDSSVRVIDTVTTADRAVRTTVRLTPADTFGNLLGPGRAGNIACATPKECSIAPKDVIDHGDGSYSVTLVAPRSVPSVRLAAFGMPLDVPIPCDECPRLGKLALDGSHVKEHNTSKGTIQLTGPTPRSASAGALVYLNSSKPMILQVPASVTIQPGQATATFPVRIGHAHDKPEAVTVSASYGGEVRTATMNIVPLVKPPSEPPAPRPTYDHAHPSTQPPKPMAGASPTLDFSGSPSRGSLEAPIVIVEFTDYQCPFCAKAQETVRQLLELYPGKIRHVVKNLPLGFHDHATSAAVAALAAGRQGKFWEFRQLLFENQQAMSESDLTRYARQLGLDMQRFEADRKDPALGELVARDVKEAAAAGANGTPTFFINGQRIEGAQPLNLFKAAVDELLSKTQTAGQ